MGACPDDLSRVRDAADKLLLLHPVSVAPDGTRPSSSFSGVPTYRGIDGRCRLSRRSWLDDNDSRIEAELAGDRGE